MVTVRSWGIRAMIRALLSPTISRWLVHLIKKVCVQVVISVNKFCKQASKWSSVCTLTPNRLTCRFSAARISGLMAVTTVRKLSLMVCSLWNWNVAITYMYRFQGGVGMLRYIGRFFRSNALKPMPAISRPSPRLYDPPPLSALRGWARRNQGTPLERSIS